VALSGGAVFLDRWLETPSSHILGEKFEPLPSVKA
jgi:hypothetical protein